MRYPVFTVIMTTYNRERVLPRSIKSVLDQTFGDFELLVIDNGSTDGTAEAVNTIKDDRVRYIRNPNPTHSCDAPRNLGIAEAKGELVSFIDDDDLWYPSKLIKTREAFEKDEDVSVVAHNLLKVLNGKAAGLIKCGPGGKDLYRTLLYERTCLSPSATTIKTKILRGAGGFKIIKEFDAIADYDLWLRLAAGNVNMYFIDEPLGEYTISSQNWSVVNPDVQARLAFLIKEHMLGYEKRPLFLVSRTGAWRLLSLYAVAARSFMRKRRWFSSIAYYTVVLLFILIRPSSIIDLIAWIKDRSIAREDNMARQII